MALRPRMHGIPYVYQLTGTGSAGFAGAGPPRAAPALDPPITRASVVGLRISEAMIGQPDLPNRDAYRLIEEANAGCHREGFDRPQRGEKQAFVDLKIAPSRRRRVG
jgi:hypothetical protein